MSPLMASSAGNRLAVDQQAEINGELLRPCAIAKIGKRAARVRTRGESWLPLDCGPTPSDESGHLYVRQSVLRAAFPVARRGVGADGRHASPARKR
jgi:hypothetical protein